MKFDDAVSLVGVPGLATNGPSTWADLGAGTGLFSVAIASLLAKQSVVYAVDKAPGIKEQTTTNAVRIVPVRKNFVSDELQLPVLDGIVMANSLHFVIDKPPMFARLRSMIRPGGILILVEYDTNSGNQWVPYPIAFDSLQDFTFINKVESAYRPGGIYGAYQRIAPYSSSGQLTQ